MLLRMLSACAPCIGYWINLTACSGQDQDPSNETIVGACCVGGVRCFTRERQLASLTRVNSEKKSAK